MNDSVRYRDPARSGFGERELSRNRGRVSFFQDSSTIVSIRYKTIFSASASVEDATFTK